MTDTRRFIELDARARLAATIVMVLLPLTAGVSGWTFTQLWDHEGRLNKLEATSYTRQEAAAMRDELKDVLSDIKQELSAIRTELKRH